MEKKVLKTRHEEIVFPTHDIDEMAGKYLAANVEREWEDTFLDDSTGEVVNITRKELVMKRGEFLSPDNISMLNFYLQTGDVKTVLVTNVKRPGEFVEVGRDTIWSVTVSGGGVNRKRKYILFAQSLDMAITIARDYLEQTLVGAFKIEAAKSYTSCIVIPDDSLRKVMTDSEGNVVEDEKVALPDFYNIQTALKMRDRTQIYMWLVLATSVDDAKVRIRKYIDRKIQEAENESDRDDWNGYELTVLSGSCASVSSVIPREFSEEYFKWDEAEKMRNNPDGLLKAFSKAMDKAVEESDDEREA